MRVLHNCRFGVILSLLLLLLGAGCATRNVGFEPQFYGAVIVAPVGMMGGQPANWNLVIYGGQAPYTVSWDFGGGANPNTVTLPNQSTPLDPDSELLHNASVARHASATDAVLSSTTVEMIDGSWVVDVVVTDRTGAVVNPTQEYTVGGTAANLAPIAALSANPGSGVSPLSVNLDASLSVDPDGAITKYEWDFDNDGTYDLDSAATATAQHTYAAPGTYVARVRVTDDGTPALSGTATATISVGQANQAPTVSVSANPASGVGPLAVTFTATAADSDGEIAKYEWDFDNDGTFDFDSGTTATAQHTYPTAGAFTVRVRVTDNGTPALQATATTGVTVNANQAPSVSVAALPDAGKVPLTVDFTATAADADGSIAKYEWDFENDGEFDLDSGTTPTANHVYPSSGTFTCLVRVTDDGNPGLTASATVDVTANANQPPAVTLDSEVTEGKGPLTVIFTAAGSDPDGTITKYEWDFDNDGTFETDTGTTPTAQHVYPVAAEIDEGHTCRVRVTDDGTPDLTATAARSITVHPNQAPTVSLQANPSQDNSPVLVTFTATASDPDGSITRYEWDWDNDGTYDEDTGTTPTAQHTFTFNEQGGPYTIGVRVTDDGVPDRMAFATTQVTVDPPNQAPTAILFPSDEGGSAPLTLTFDGSQSFDNDGVITKYEWDWDGDGVYDEDSGTTSTVQHTYTVPGQYHVTLRVTDDGNPLLTGVSEEFIIFVFGGD